MSHMHTGDWTPEWDLQDRLHKALRIGGYTAVSLAAAIGVHRNSVNNYLSGRITPDKRTLMAWAMACGVPFEWLSTGRAGEPPHPDDGGREDGNRVTVRYLRLPYPQVTPDTSAPTCTPVPLPLPSAA